MTQNPEHSAAVMALQSTLLSTISAALALDLAVAPIILATDPGIGTNHMARGIAEGMDMVFLDVRCMALSGHDFRPLHIPTKDGIVMAKPATAFITEQLSGGVPAFVLLDEAFTTGAEVVLGLLRQIADAATGPVIVALRVAHGDEAKALDAIAEGLGIHKAHVPTARLAYGRPVSQPILLTGLVQMEGSKRWVRYMTMLTEEPFDMEARFRVNAKEQQSDDELTTALEPVFRHGTPVSGRFEIVDGSLVCSTDDLTPC